MKTTLILLEVTHPKDYPNLAEIAAQRIYNIEGVDDCIVIRSVEEKVKE